MSRIRLHLPADRWDRRVELEPAERRHLIDVLRLNPGSRIEVFDGQGAIAGATLISEGRSWCLQVDAGEHLAEHQPVVHLALALLKGKKHDLVIRMATELGITSIQPLTSARSVPRPDAERLKNRLQRWRSLASQAARQSQRSSVPTIEPCRPLADLLRDECTAAARILLHEKEDTSTFLDLLDGIGDRERLLLVGPEGGFEDQEVEAARASGFEVVGLGLPVLRADTAAVAAVAFACASSQRGVQPSIGSGSLTDGHPSSMGGPKDES